MVALSKHNGRRAAGGMVGGVVAGLELSVAMLVGEKLSGQPSELIELERATVAKIGWTTPQGDAVATVGEQLFTHGGHFALSVLVGLACAGLVDADSDSPQAGAAFGAAFFISAYGVVGSGLDVTSLPWRQPPLRAIQHPVIDAVDLVSRAGRWCGADAPHRPDRGGAY